MMTNHRRGFLRGLTSLPLVGGSVALIGQPSAAAAPVTEALMRRYVAWLAREHAEALVDYQAFRHLPPEEEQFRRAHRDWMKEWVRQPLFWFADDEGADANVKAAPSTTRAAVVLSAVGCPLPL